MFRRPMTYDKVNVQVQLYNRGNKKALNNVPFNDLMKWTQRAPQNISAGIYKKTLLKGWVDLYGTKMKLNDVKKALNVKLYRREAAIEQSNIIKGKKILSKTVEAISKRKKEAALQALLHYLYKPTGMRVAALKQNFNRIASTMKKPNNGSIRRSPNKSL